MCARSITRMSRLKLKPKLKLRLSWSPSSSLDSAVCHASRSGRVCRKPSVSRTNCAGYSCKTIVGTIDACDICCQSQQIGTVFSYFSLKLSIEFQYIIKSDDILRRYFLTFRCNYRYCFTTIVKCRFMRRLLLILSGTIYCQVVFYLPYLTIDTIAKSSFKALNNSAIVTIVMIDLRNYRSYYR